MNVAVTIRDLSITYAKKDKALQNVSLEIPTGRITGLIGPSGSGKTTLIKSVVGRLKLPTDKVTVLDLPAGSAKLRKKVAYMAQELAVYHDLTVRQNLAYFTRVLGFKYSGVKRRVNETLRAVDLYDKRNSMVGNLSGGQQQRVSLGVALLGHPKLLVLDEPTTGLDPVLIENLWQLFHELVEDGTTIIISSHSMSEAARCDDLVLMRSGKIIATGAPKKLMKQTGADDVEQAFLHLVKGEEE
ncbi:ABC transporter ATP-binding protein [Candidatus Saccharibacteria bacterium]|nr:ABC transporter ATP-binding protein [Candidatus Saccharibacteria bacterium]